MKIDESHRINDIVNTLNLINYEVAELLRIKEELEAKINVMIGHPEDSQKTYTLGAHKVTITRKYNYSLDKEEYEAIGYRLPEQFNPVKMKTIYELDKKIIKAAEMYASESDMQVLSSFISKKEAKLHVKITAGV